MKCYKLTDKDGYTGRQSWVGRPTKWGEGVTKKISLDFTAREHLEFEGNHLCTPFWFHAYLSPHYARLWDRSQGGYLRREHYEGVLLWECETGEETSIAGAKLGAKVLTTIRQIPIPEVLSKQEFREIIEPIQQVVTDLEYMEGNYLEEMIQEEVTHTYGYEFKDLFNKHYEENYEKQQ